MIAKIQPKTDKWIWIEDIVEICEQSCSCEIFSVLKRPDEKVVTERAYENPMFVEDVARNAYEKLSEIDNIKTFSVKVASDESIHMHRAEAVISYNGNKVADENKSLQLKFSIPFETQENLRKIINDEHAIKSVNDLVYIINKDLNG